MQRVALDELDRIAMHFEADLIIAQETGIENSEYRETKNFAIWTASDKEAKERKEKDIKEIVTAKGRGKGKRPRDIDKLRLSRAPTRR